MNLAPLLAGYFDAPAALYSLLNRKAFHAVLPDICMVFCALDGLPHMKVSQSSNKWYNAFAAQTMAYAQSACIFPISGSHICSGTSKTQAMLQLVAKQSDFGSDCKLHYHQLAINLHQQKDPCYSSQCI